MRIAQEACFKKHGREILHYLLRNPCATTRDILLAIEGNQSTIRTRLKELEEEGFIDSTYSVKNNCKIYAIHEMWVNLAVSIDSRRFRW